jgi:aspartyl protease family protein
MSLSRGNQNALVDAVSWVAAFGFAAVALVFHAEIKTAGYELFGITPPDLHVTAATIPVRADHQTSSGRGVELRAGANGHFFTEVEVNGRRIDTMVDTGASVIALTFEDAIQAGVAPSPSDFTHTVNTANGVSRVAPVMLDRVQIGDIVVRNVQGVVIERGKLNTTLLGNSFLSRLSRYEMRSGRLLMEE